MISRNSNNKKLRRLALAGLLAATFGLPATAGPLLFLSNGRNPTDLLKIDLASNQASFVLTFGTSADIHAIAICPGRDTLIAVGRNPATVSAVDLGAALPSETLLGQLPLALVDRVVQMACALDGTIYFTDTQSDSLYSLDLLTCPICTPVLVGTIETGVGLADVEVEGADIEFTGDGTLYLLTNGKSVAGRRLYQVDRATALATLIGTVATGTNTGMAVTSDDRLIISSNDDNLYEIDRTDASVVALGQPMLGAVPLDINNGDLASPLPTCICRPRPPSDGMGCTPGYWKNHTDSWPPTGYSPGQSVASVFTAAAAYPAAGSSSLLEALSFGGGPGVEGAVRILLRAAVAALLNASHPGVAYPRTPAQVISDVDSALASADRDTMLSLAAALDSDNNLGCPLNSRLPGIAAARGGLMACDCLGACEPPLE